MIRALGWQTVALWAFLSLANAIPGGGWAKTLSAVAIALGTLALLLSAYHRGRSHMAAELAAMARAARLAGTDGGP